MKETYDQAVAKNNNQPLDNEQVMKLLPTFWNTMQSQGLLEDIKKKGFGYAQFVNCAQSQRAKAEFMEKLNIDFNVIFRGK